MTVEFRLPDIGEGLHEAEVVTWLVAVGDTVDRNQPFVEIMTDKSTVEMPAPAAGTISRLGAEAGDIIQVGDILVVIDDAGGAVAAPEGDRAPGEAPPDGPASPGAGTSAAAPAPTGSATPTPPIVAAPVPGVGRRPKASPSTRRLAARLGIDLTAVEGTGPGGRILADDVQALADDGPRVNPTAVIPPPPRPTAAPAHVPAAPPAAAGAGPDQAASGSHRRPIPPGARLAPGVHPLRGIRRATARAMDRSWSTIPHISAMHEIDAAPLLSLRAQLKEHREPSDPNITPLVLALVAVARALRRHPVMNASLDLEAGTITIQERVNLGIAVATDRGLLVPVIADADRLGVAAMAAEVHRLTTAARNGTATAADLAAGTHTVTNFGSHGTYTAAPIIRPDESGITGLGGIAERPFVVDGQVVATPTLPVVVCGDHRLIDGDVLSSFHLDICDALSSPLGLLL